MKIKSIYIDGLHNAVNKTYNFGDITYIFGNNGAGKSTILQAIQFALLGYIPGTAKNSKEALLRHSPKAEITVILTLDDITITRKTWKLGNRIDIDPVTYDIRALVAELELPIFNFNDFVNQTANKLKEYFIQNILPKTDGKLDWDKILTESILSINMQDRDKTIKYGLDLLADKDNSDIENNSILSQVVRANMIFKNEQSFNKSELQRLQNTIDSLIYYDDYVGPNNLSDLNSELLSLNAIRDQLLRYESAASATKAAKDEYDRLESDINALGGREGYDKLISLLAQLKQRNIELSNNITERNKNLAGLIAIDKASDSIINSKGICPYTKSECKSILNEIDKMRSDAVQRKADMIEERGQIENLNAELNVVQLSIRQCESKIQDYQTTWNRLVTLQKTMNDLPEKPNTNKSIFELDEAIAKLSDSKMKLQANIKYNETIDNLTAMKYDLESKEKVLSNWIKTTDTNGLQTTLMLNQFNTLSDTLTALIRKMYGRDDIKANFNISNKANSFSFGLVRNNIYIPYDMLSSGEKCLYNLALMICISNNNKSPLKLLLCDDMFDHLDNIAIENTFKSLRDIDDIQFIFAGVNDCENAKDCMLRIE